MSARLFRRPPRLREMMEPVELDLPQPPTPPRTYPRTPIIQLLLMAMLPTLLPPAVLGFAMYLAGAGQTVIITSAALAGSLGVAVTVTTLLSRRDEDARLKTEQREYEAQRHQFEQELAFVAHDARSAVAREQAVLHRQFPSPDGLTRQTVAITSALWNRRPADDDFLELRLGIGRRRTCAQVPRDALRTGDAKILELDQVVAFHEAVPITARFADASTGVFGDPSQLRRFASWLISQSAAHHAPTDLKIILLSKDVPWIDNVKWLPHCRQSQGTTGARIASTGRDVQVLLGRVLDDLKTRGETAGARYFIVADGRGWPALPTHIEPLVRAQQAGVTIVQVQRAYEEIGGDCAFVLDLTDPAHALVLRREERHQPIPFQADSLEPEQEREIVLALAPLTLLESGGTGTVPEHGFLSDVLPGATDPMRVLETWNRCRDEFRLAAPIGRGPDGVMVEIDFRKDGPHALLAGTTGSGKSEFLQSMVASFAARIPPDLLNFLLIDYKGGSAFLEVSDLPHVVGVVTDLDERLSARALTSLRAEMKRREHLLAAAGAANITDYQEKPRSVPLANLIILIDEFHRLVSEVPDFVDQMIQIAQQGRSLGVHLLLSTQKPSGVVSEYIRSNTNLRMCLRVTDESDSRDVLGSSEAAYIGRGMPGRLFVRRGNEAIEPCQAGRLSGGSSKTAEGVSADWFVSGPPVQVRKGEISVEDVTPPRAAPAATDGEEYRAQLIESIRAAAASASMPIQMPPWQPYLPEMLALEELQQAPTPVPSLEVTIGIVDEPESQTQRPLTIDLAAGHVLIAGAANSGKTETLLTIAAAAASTYETGRVHMYGLDFAGGDLKSLAELPHCGGVASQSAPAEVQWVLGMLRETVQRRLVEGARASWPQLLVFVDNIGAFYAAIQASGEGPDAADQLLELLDVGRSVSVSFVLTTEQPASIRPSLMALMSTRVVFELADDEGYAYVGLQRAVRPSRGTPGRGLLPGHVVHDVQVARSNLQAMHVAARGALPLRVSPLPASVRYPVESPAPADSGMCLGLEDGLDPSFERPLSEHLLIVGPHGSGRSNALAVVVHELARSGFGPLFVLNPRRSAMLRAAAQSRDCRYAERADELGRSWEAIEDELRRRLDAFDSGGDAGPPWAVVIDDAELVEPSPGGADALRHLIQRGVDVNGTVLMAAEPQAARAAYSFDALRTLINLQSGILLRPSTTDDFAMFGVRGRPGRLPAGRGYACFAGEKKAVQIYALSD
jgi:S-DNA-T family DNA segregation ATPase FtsK/SpoIIIE